MTKQMRDNVFELFHGPEKDIPETPLDVARPVAASLPVAAAGSAVDLTGKPKIIMLMAPGSAGKAQPNDAPVLTPTGFKPMGTLEVGDLVTCPDGKTSHILGVFPQGEKEIYQIEFHDGRTVECCDDHLWKVWSSNSTYETGKSHGDRRRVSHGGWRIKPLSELREKIATDGKSPRQLRSIRELGIPLIAPFAIETPPHTDLPIHPYALGALLGNGHFGSLISISTPDQHVVERVIATLEEYEANPVGRYDYRLRMRDPDAHPQPNCRVRKSAEMAMLPRRKDDHGREQIVLSYNGREQTLALWAKEIGVRKATLYERLAHGGWSIEESLRFEPREPKDRVRSPAQIALKQLGLEGSRSHTKFVPEAYKRGSVSQRLALLQGLLDTDGSSGGAYATFSSTSEQLAKDVQEIAWSLGAIAPMRKRQTYHTHKGIRKPGRPSWRVSIVHPHITEFFSLPRKLSASRESTINSRLRITSIKSVGRKQATCIAIDHPDHLYVTNNYVVTHNSTFARWMVERALNRDDAPELVLASADAQNPTLKRFFPTTMVPQSAGGVTQFLMTLLDKLIGRKMSAVIDMGGDMTLAPVLTQVAELQQIMLDAGVEPVVFYLLTPRQSDLAVLKTMETMEFRPTATCLLRNLGRTTNPGAPDEEQYGEFARIRKHSAYRGVVSRGAVELWMPRLWAARDIEDNGFGFYQATNGGRLGEFAKRQTSRWLTDMELVMAPVSSWLP